MARAAAAAGLVVAEVQRPRRADRRRGKSDPIDAHLAALQVLRMAADRLPIPRADGDRQALAILLGARREMTVSKTRQINRLPALLLGGDDCDRELARGPLTTTRLQAISGRGGRSAETTADTVRRCAARRLAIAIAAAITELSANNNQLTALVAALAPGLLVEDRRRTGQRSAGHRVLVAPPTMP